MDTERVRAQLKRVLESSAFADVERGKRFLRFVVEASLEGRSGVIKESVIGVEALGRSASFDPKTDPIVRVEARRLRDRLSSYYAGEGRSDAVLISLPKGGYVPEFSERNIADESGLEWKGFVLTLVGWTLFGLAATALVIAYLRKPAENAGTLRLSILPPEGTSFESFAVSPDGRKLAFTAVWKGRLMLWVRALDSVDAKVLVGTEFGAFPFWSPDSQSIGFFAPSKLKIIEVTGGPPRDIADVTVGHGGAWSANGIIIFCPSPLGVVYEVPVSGGWAKPVTSLDARRGEVSHRFPVFLPDGRHFLYLAASSRPGESSIRLGSLDSPNSKVLLSADTSAAYAPVLPGHPSSLLFVSDGALIAQKFDPQGAVLSGERAVVVPQIRYERWQPAGFSVSGNGVLLYRGGTSESHQFAWFDRQGRVVQKIGPHNNFMGFNLSPDDVHVAIVRTDDSATVMPTIWIMDLSREGAVSRFSETGIGEADFSPVWSPDGRELLFSRGTDRRMRLLVQASNGGPVKAAVETDGPKFPTDWSSDGRFVTYGSQWPDYRNMHTWTFQLSGSPQTENPRAFLEHSYDDVNAAFSPADKGNGPRWIAYTSDETGRDEVYVRDFPSGVHKWRISAEGGWLPHWRRDGRELFYLALDGTLMAVGVRPGAKFEVQSPRPLFETDLRLSPLNVMNQYAVTLDAQRFLLNQRVPETLPGPITAVVPW
jgi:Tol biopolymer transport system component